MKQIKYWAVDHFHALKHKKTRGYNPLYVRRLAKRFKGISLNAAEQVFSWFRNFARLINEARPLRHAFKVLYFVKEHNKAIHNNKAKCLNKRQNSLKKPSKKYVCVKKVLKKPAAKFMKVMTAMKAMK